MGDRPIIFSGSMILALLACRKSQTRRVLKAQGPMKGADLTVCPSAHISGDWIQFDHPLGGPFTCVRPPYAIGDKLWVRERWAKVGDNDDDIHACPDLRVHAYYRADAVCPEHLRWRSPIFMPRRFSRLTLTVEDVRVERLQSITATDAIAEGIDEDSDYANLCVNIEGSGYPNDLPKGSWAVAVFRRLWSDINGRASWDANPWISAVRFSVALHNIDATSPAERAAEGQADTENVHSRVHIAIMRRAAVGEPFDGDVSKYGFAPMTKGRIQRPQNHAAVFRGVPLFAVDPVNARSVRALCPSPRHVERNATHFAMAARDFLFQPFRGQRRHFAAFRRSRSGDLQQLERPTSRRGPVGLLLGDASFADFRISLLIGGRKPSALFWSLGPFFGTLNAVVVGLISKAAMSVFARPACDEIAIHQLLTFPILIDNAPDQVRDRDSKPLCFLSQEGDLRLRKRNHLLVHGHRGYHLVTT